MATFTASQRPLGRVSTSSVSAGDVFHRILISIGSLAAAGLIAFLIVHGFSYYTLGLEQRPFSPLHAELRSSGTIGLRLGILSLIMFGFLFLYPLRKHWRWLSTIGSTRRWLNFHVLFGITTPIVVTFHTSFKWHGVAGTAYWIMVAVALSGFVGRYVYAKIPRSLGSVDLSMADIEGQMGLLAGRLKEQALFRVEDLNSLLEVPSPQQIRAMNTIRMLWTMLRMDLKRPFQVSSLRRRVIHGRERITTLGGLLASKHSDLEQIITHARRQSRLRAAVAFLDRTSRVFHLWHIVHRPFSISFIALLVVHIFVVLSVGL
jgi:hypothetical protein